MEVLLGSIVIQQVKIIRCYGDAFVLWVPKTLT